MLSSREFHNDIDDGMQDVLSISARQNGVVILFWFLSG